MAEAQRQKMVLWLENRCHRFEAWQSCLSQGRCLSREEEDQGQMGGQASQSGASDHDRHPLIWSERPTWTFTHPTLQLAPPRSIRSWHVPLCVGVCQVQDRCTSPTPVKPTPRGSDSKTMPQEDDGLAITQHQARKTSLGGSTGSYGFSHGHQPEHPLRMGEDSR